jgi:hypothetical protein
MFFNLALLQREENFKAGWSKRKKCEGTELLLFWLRVGCLTDPVGAALRGVMV